MSVLAILAIIVGALAWFALGVLGGVWYWTESSDLESEDMPILLFAGFAGLIFFGIGLSCRLSKKMGGESILLKRRYWDHE